MLVADAIYVHLAGQFGDTQVVDHIPAVRDHNPSGQGRTLTNIIILFLYFYATAFLGLKIGV